MSAFNMPALPPLQLWRSNPQGWSADMQDFCNDAVEAVAAILLIHAASPAHALCRDLTEALDGYHIHEDEDRLTFMPAGDDSVIVRNTGSDDGCTLVRRAEGWWIDGADPAESLRPGFHALQFVAGEMLSYVWFGDLEYILLRASLRPEDFEP
jgi:hypothetical protein